MSDSVQALVPLVQYQESRAHVFPSLESIRWHARNHKQELIDGGALVMVAGRTFVVPERYDDVVLKAGKVAAQQRAGAA